MTKDDPRRKETPAEAEERKKRDAELDEALDESFPASDPPSTTAPGGGH